MKSIYFKNFLLTVVLILMSFLILGTALLSYSYSYLTRDRQEQLEKVAAGVSSYASAAFTRNDVLVVDMYFNIMATFAASVSDTGILICDPAGTVIMSSEGPGSRQLGKNVGLEAAGDVNVFGQHASSGLLGDVYQYPVYAVGVPIRTDAGEGSAMVFATSPVSDPTGLITVFMRVFLIVAAISLLVTYISAYLASRRLARPLDIMANAAGEFARGEFGRRVNVGPRQDEIAELAVAFNLMADALEKSEQLRREFIAGVSHELRTPMTTIAGYIDGILDGTIEPARQQEYLTTVRDEIYRLSRLVRRMLDIARMQAETEQLPLRSLDICELTRRMLLSFEKRIDDKNLSVDVNFAQQEIMTLADSDTISQVIYNLLDNAIKFSTPGGLLELKIYTGAGKAYVSVINVGAAIAPEELPYVFDRFHKADKSRGIDREGMGLGLYITKMIINNHKEGIWVKSEDGKTEFTFSLTLSRNKSSKPLLN